MPYTFISPQMPGLSPAYALNPNPTFQPVAGPYVGVPPGWVDWAYGYTTTTFRNGLGLWTAAISGIAGADTGVKALIGAGQVQGFPGAGWYMLEAAFYLAAGSLSGGGVLAQFDDAAFATLYEAGQIVFSTDPDIYGSVNGAGVVGTNYAYRKLVQVKDARSVACQLYAMSHYDGFGADSAANQLDWTQCSIRPATFAEIAAGNAQFGMPVFPVLPGQTVTVSKAPLWSTKVKRAASGRERRTALWPYPLWQFEIGHEVLRHRPTNDELSALWTFFNQVQGQYQPWLFLDPTDCTSNTDSSSYTQFATGDGATTTFQMTRFLGPVPNPSILGSPEPVYAPFGVSVYLNGSPVSSGYTINPYGQMVFSTAPSAGAAIGWGGYFYFGCRFSQDDLTFEQIVSQLWSGKSLKFTSLRV